MADLTDLQQMVDQAWAYAHLARHYAREARLRATRTTQEVQHASHRARMAYLRLSMPAANPLTLAITATLLAGHGLLDEKLTLRPLRPATGGRRWRRTMFVSTAAHSSISPSRKALSAPSP